MESNYFTALNRINVSQFLEKKGEFTYLSWPYVVAQLRQADPTATWEMKRFESLPNLKTECGYFVEVAVTVQGITLNQIHPVLDSKNERIEAPNALDINTSIQRCLVKAIALHGLGIAAYCGEDLPQCEQAQAPEPTGAPKAPVTAHSIAPPATPAQVRYLERLIAETGHDLERLLKFFGAESLDELTKQSASRTIKSLEKTREVA